jgi:hypothetical protein
MNFSEVSSYKLDGDDHCRGGCVVKDEQVSAIIGID